jgi:hypothetical protein
MKTISITQNIIRVAALSLLALAFSTTTHLQAEDNPRITEQSQLAKSVIGTWILVGIPGQVSEPPAKGGRLQFFTGRHWLITQADPETGEVIFHHGGTYTLDGDQLVKTVEYANKNTAALIKEAHKFKIEIEGDTLTQTGIGNPWTEVWKRVK